MIFEPFTIAGIIGSALIIAAYFAIQQGLLSVEDWRYPTVNLIGAVMILLSLITAWHLHTAVIESFWAAISLYGLAKIRRRQGNP